MYKFSEFVVVKLLRTSNFAMIYDKRTGDTSALAYTNYKLTPNDITLPRERAFFESSFKFETFTFQKALRAGLIVEV